jgi:hypothetical protein
MPKSTSGRDAIEAWVCYSTISFFLYKAQRKISNKRLRLLIAKGSPFLQESSCLRSEVLKRCDINAYTRLGLVTLCLKSIARGEKLAVRVPHLNPPTFHGTLAILARIGLIRLELYDDGFLGIVGDPAVCKYLKPIFSSVVCWDIEGWALSRSVFNSISKRNKIDIIRLPIKETAISWRGENKESAVTRTFIVEAKYMDYQYLSEFLGPWVNRNRFAGKSSDLIPEYFQHPWEIKRNTLWPNEMKRTILKRDPLERYLTRNLIGSSTVITGMTTTAIWICELAKKGVLPRFGLVLLLSDENKKTEFHTSCELNSFLDFLTSSYQACTRMFISLNGQVMLDELETVA